MWSFWFPFVDKDWTMSKGKFSRITVKAEGYPWFVFCFNSIIISIGIGSGRENWTWRAGTLRWDWGSHLLGKWFSQPGYRMSQDRYKSDVSLPTEFNIPLKTNVCPGLSEEVLMPPSSLIPVLFGQLALACRVSGSYLDKRKRSAAKQSELTSFLSMHTRFPSTQTCLKVTSTHTDAHAQVDTQLRSWYCDVQKVGLCKEKELIF